MQKIAWDITWDNLGAEPLQTQQYRGMDPMDSKQRIVALQRFSRAQVQRSNSRDVWRSFGGKANFTRNLLW